MGSINAFGAIMADWRRLLGAWQYHAELLSGSVEERDSLAQALKDAEALKAVQDQLQGERQAVTQQLNALVAQGKETAIRIRSLVRSRIGPKSEQLVQFRIAPIRPRKSRREASAETPPAAK
jgi:cell division protein FtsB